MALGVGGGHQQRQTRGTFQNDEVKFNRKLSMNLNSSLKMNLAADDGFEEDPFSRHKNVKNGK